MANPSPSSRQTTLVLAVALLGVVAIGSGAVIWRVMSVAEQQQLDAGLKAADADAENSAEAAGAFTLGDKLPNFSVHDGAGKGVELKEVLDGEHYVVVNFHHPDCPCAANCGRLISEMQANGYDDVKVIGIMTADTRNDRVLQALDEQLKDGTISYPVYFDHDGAVRELLGATRTPEMWVLDKDGTIAFYGAPENTLFPGSPGHRYLLREAIDALRAGQQPEIRRYDPIGCPIEG